MNDIVNDLVRDEGFEPLAYRDRLGKLTIGIGFLIDPEEPGRIEMPRAVADLWVLEILKERCHALDDAIPWWRDLSKARRCAILNMSYQLGVAGLLRFTKTLAFLKSGDWEGAATEAMDSRWAKQTPERAQRICELLRNG